MPIPVLPPSAPFTADQRAYLNGFFAGLFSTSGDGASVQAAPLPAPEPAAPPEDESMPWHDPALSLDDRLVLAQDRPIVMQLMATMAQLDCGQCGYACHSYAQAIADGSEKSLRKCVPGGKETATKLKELSASL